MDKKIRPGRHGRYAIYFFVLSTLLILCLALTDISNLLMVIALIFGIFLTILFGVFETIKNRKEKGIVWFSALIVIILSLVGILYTAYWSCWAFFTLFL